MIQRDFDGWLSLVCDECGSSAEDSFLQANFADMLADAREAGWSITKVGETWQHLCADCASEEQFSRQMSLFD